MSGPGNGHVRPRWPGTGREERGPPSGRAGARGARRRVVAVSGRKAARGVLGRAFRGAGHRLGVRAGGKTSVPGPLGVPPGVGAPPAPPGKAGARCRWPRLRRAQRQGPVWRRAPRKGLSGLQTSEQDAWRVAWRRAAQPPKPVPGFGGLFLDTFVQISPAPDSFTSCPVLTSPL